VVMLLRLVGISRGPTGVLKLSPSIPVGKAMGTFGDTSTRLRPIKSPRRRSEAGMKPMWAELILALSGLFNKGLRGKV